MTDAAVCPSKQELYRWLDAALDDADSDRLTQHVDGCPRCLETIVDLDVNATLVEDLRQWARTPADGDEPAVAALIDRLARENVAHRLATAAAFDSSSVTSIFI